MVTDSYGRTQLAGAAAGAGAAGQYYTNIVTATAAAVYAQAEETVYLDDGAFSRHPITWELLLISIGISLVIL